MRASFAVSQFTIINGSCFRAGAFLIVAIVGIVGDSQVHSVASASSLGSLKLEDSSVDVLVSALEAAHENHTIVSVNGDGRILQTDSNVTVVTIGTRLPKLSQSEWVQAQYPHVNTSLSRIDCSPNGTGKDTGLIRRVWTKPLNYTRVDAVLRFDAFPFAYHYPVQSDTGYAYFSGRGSQCQNFEAGFLFSTANRWWTPYLRFDKSFGALGQKNGYVLATKRCDPHQFEFCKNGGLSKGPSQGNVASYHITLAVGTLRVCHSAACGETARYKTAFVFQAYPAERSSREGISIVAFSPETSAQTWNGWGSPCKCVIIRETNIAQQQLNRDADERFGPISWTHVTIDGKPWRHLVSSSCESWDGFVDLVGFKARVNTTSRISASFLEDGDETDIVNPGKYRN